MDGSRSSPVAAPASGAAARWSSPSTAPTSCSRRDARNRWSRPRQEIEALGRRALTVSTDVTIADECQQLVDTTVAELGRVDILVNNAGGAQTKSVMKWTEEEWLQVMALNLGSVWFLSRAAVKPMLEQGKGAIVNISSGASLLAMPQAAPYAAAKAGVNNLTGSMAAAWTGKGVRVNAIAVGAVRAASLLDDARAVRARSRSHWHDERLGPPRRARRDRVRRALLRVRRLELLLRPDPLHARRPRTRRHLTWWFPGTSPEGA